MARAVAVRGAGKCVSKRRSEGRARLWEAFVSALAADYEAHGAGAIAALRIERPQDYVKLVASLLPKDAAAGEGGENDAIPTAIEVRFVRPEG